jgi:cell division protein FtsL
MFINQSAQVYIRPLRSSPVRRQVLKRVLGLFGPKVMMMAGGKILLAFCLLFVPVHFWLSSSAARVATAVQEAEVGQSALADEYIGLKAERAYLLSPEYLEKMAAQRLALYVPDKKQVFRF